MHVIVTGGAGFVGSNVAAAYLRAGCRVTVCDTLCRPGTELNLEWLMSQPQATQLAFVRGDVRDAALVQRLLGAPDVQLVLHCAAQTAVTTSVAQPREDLETNLLGTFNVLEALRHSQAPVAPVLLYPSTNKVYGALAHRGAIETASRYRFTDDRLHQPGVAETEALDFQSPYGCSKGAADQYVRDYSRIYGLRTVVFRMSCIYGPRQFGNEDQGWVAHFLIAAATGSPLTIYGNGKQARDLLYVDDLVRAFELATRNIATTAGNVYNIGGGPANSMSIWLEFQPRLETLCGRPLRAVMGDWRPGDQPVYVSDTSAAARDFEWTPEISLDDGLERLWSWIQAHRELLEALVPPNGGSQTKAADAESVVGGGVLAQELA